MPEGEKKRERRKVTAEGMKLRMADLCMRSEQCESDIRGKLIRSGLSSSSVEEIVAYLKKEMFIDEKRFARAFARDKVKFSGWGRMKIRLYLIGKRITSEVIADALEGIDMKEYEESLKKLAVSKSKDLNLRRREDNAKLYRRLVSRGFESGEVVRIIRNLRSGIID